MEEDFNTNEDSMVRGLRDPNMRRVVDANQLGNPNLQKFAFQRLPADKPTNLADAPQLRQAFQGAGLPPMYPQGAPNPMQSPTPPKAPGIGSTLNLGNPPPQMPPQTPQNPQPTTPVPDQGRADMFGGNPQDMAQNGRMSPMAQPNQTEEDPEEQAAIQTGTAILNDEQKRMQATQMAFAPGAALKINPASPEVMAGVAANPTEETLTRFSSMTNKDVDLSPAGALCSDAAEGNMLKPGSIPYDPQGNCFNDDGVYSCPLTKQPCGKKSFFARFIEALKQLFGVSDPQRVQQVIEQTNQTDPIAQEYMQSNQGGGLGRLSAASPQTGVSSMQGPNPQAAPPMNRQTNLADLQG